MPHHDEAATSIQSTGDGTPALKAAHDFGTRRVTSTDLFRGGRELEIDHNGRRYQLRITQTGKLILTA